VNNFRKDTIDDFIPVTGGKVWYKIVGCHAKKTPLLILHGGPGANCGYLKPLEALGAQRPVIFYDQLGCGNSERPRGIKLWTLGRYVEELSQVRKSLGLETVHIFGASWGKMLAVEYILSKQPTGIASLLLSGPAVSVSRWIADQRAYIKRLPREIHAIINRAEKHSEYSSREYQKAMLIYYKRHLCRLKPWPGYLKESFTKINSDIYEHMWGPSEFTCTGTLKHYERAQDLRNIRTPTLFLTGRHDEASPQTAAYYQGLLPGSLLRVIEDASHMHLLEKTKECLSVIRKFIADFDRIPDKSVTPK